MRKGKKIQEGRNKKGVYVDESPGAKKKILPEMRADDFRREKKKSHCGTSQRLEGKSSAIGARRLEAAEGKERALIKKAR